MTAPVHIPVLRQGEPYRSLRLETLTHAAGGEPVAEVSQANAGLIARDLSRVRLAQRELAALPAEELLRICRRAGGLFAAADLPLGEREQPFEEYVAQLSATTGLPRTLCRGNAAKISSALEQMPEVVGGLTRGAGLEVIDSGWGEQGGRTLSYRRLSDVLGAVLPNNSPGVHTLWLPALALKVPLALKPGSREPWTPFRIAQAFIAAGCPPAAFSLYPGGHDAAGELLLRCGRSLLFGGEETVAPWRGDPRVEIHGPGCSKILFGEDAAGDWERALPLLLSSVADNSGRSCINASGVWVPRCGREIAEALARRLAETEPLPLDHPDAALAAFPDPEAARRISDFIDRNLETPGAADLSAAVRGSGRVASAGGCTFLRPTVIWCEDPDHPLADTEFLFPFAAVVETPAEEMPERIGPSLVVTALTEDRELQARLMGSAKIDRLNFGEVATNEIAWDQPHEGNLFELLYRQRAFTMRRRA